MLTNSIVLCFCTEKGFSMMWQHCYAMNDIQYRRDPKLHTKWKIHELDMNWRISFFTLRKFLKFAHTSSQNIEDRKNEVCSLGNLLTKRFHSFIAPFVKFQVFAQLSGFEVAFIAQMYENGHFMWNVETFQGFLWICLNTFNASVVQKAKMM